MLGAGEDQERALLFLEHELQQAELAVLLDFVDVQVDVLGRLGGGADRDRAPDSSTCDFDQVRDRGFDGGGEEQRLALGGHRRQDQLDGRQEAHVEHAVGFVEHQDLDGVRG